MQATSIEAYRSLKEETKERMHQRILAGLEKIGKGTSYDISFASGLTESQTHKRLSELAFKGKIYDTGERKVNPTGRKGIVWQLEQSLQSA